MLTPGAEIAVQRRHRATRSMRCIHQLGVEPDPPIQRIGGVQGLKLAQGYARAATHLRLEVLDPTNSVEEHVEVVVVRRLSKGAVQRPLPPFGRNALDWLQYALCSSKNWL